MQEKTEKTHFHLMYPVLIVVIMTIGVFFFVKQSQKEGTLSSEAATTNCTVSASQLTTKTQEQQLFDEINLYRAQEGIGQLTWDTTLKTAAAWLSADLLTHNTLSHTDSLGRTTDIRLSNCGYNIADGFAENLAEGSPSADLIFNAWKNNLPDNQILLNNTYNIGAIDMEATTNGQNAFWTMELGNSAGTTTTTPAALTTTPATTLTPVTSGTLTPTPTDTISASPNPFSPTPGPLTSDMLISVTVKINGIGQGGNTSPKHQTRKVTAYVYGTGTTPVTTGTGFLTYDGSNYFTGTIHLGQLSQGPYLIKIGSDDTLQVLAQPAFQTLLIGKVNPIPQVLLYQGDLNGDNVLDINDYNLALPCFQSRQCNDMSVDFNDDGVINVLDYNLFLQSFETLRGD